MSRLHCNVSYLASLEKTIEVDPRVPGNRDELPFPQAKQCSQEYGSPSFQFKCPFIQTLSIRIGVTGKKIERQ